MSSSMVEMQALYEQQGYLSGMSVLSTAELQEARDAFAKLERKFGEEYTSYSLHNVHLEYNWVMALTKHPKLLELVKAILGPDVILLDSRFICKYPVLSHSSATKQEGNGVIPYAKWSDASEVDSKTDTNQQDKTGLPFVAWHQDMRYWGLAGGPVLSVWLALDDSSEDNGALQVIPGSHLSGLLTHQTAQRAGNMLSVNQEIPEELVQTENSILCPLQAGQMSVHDGLLVHASDPNMSGWRRCGFVIRYIPTTAYPIQDPERPRHFHATVLVSGHDQHNHFSNQL